MRTADRIYVEGPSFQAREFWQLELAFKRVHEQLKQWLRPSVLTHVRCTSEGGSKLFHERGVEERIRRLLLEPTYSVPPLESAEDDNDAHEQQLLVRIVKDKVTLFIDSSGAPLHQRGWRLEAGKMPLRSTVAAAMLFEAGFHAPDAWPTAQIISASSLSAAATAQPGGTMPAASASSPRRAPTSHGVRPLVDPFCGSGTLPIEAAQMALGLPPHMRLGDASPHRTFAFQRWPSFAPGTWASVQSEMVAQTMRATERLEDHLGRVARGEGAGSLPPIVGGDRDLGAVKSARRNAERAGVSDLVRFDCCSVSELLTASPRVDALRRWSSSSEARGASEQQAAKAQRVPPGGSPGEAAEQLGVEEDGEAAGSSMPLLISNPPWGLRSSKSDDQKRALDRKLYGTLGTLVTERCEGWALALLCKEQPQGWRVSKALKPALQITSGGRKTWLMTKI